MRKHKTAFTLLLAACITLGLGFALSGVGKAGPSRLQSPRASAMGSQQSDKAMHPALRLKLPAGAGYAFKRMAALNLQQSRRSKRSAAFVSKAETKDGIPIEDVSAVVVGSGVSGSSLAFHLDQANVDVVCAEANDVVGGNLISRKNEQGFLWEEGPNTFQPTPQILRYAHDLGIAKDLVFADSKLPRLVFWDNQLFPLPSKPQDAVFNFGLLSWPGKIRAGLGALGIPPFYQPPPSGREESIEEFVTRHLGEETFTKVIDPFVSGVYAGDPQKLAIRAALKKIFALEQLSATGGFIPGAAVRIKQKKDDESSPAYKAEWREGVEMMPPGGSLGSFRNGLVQLAEATEQHLNRDVSGQSNKKKKLRTSWKLRDIRKDEDDEGYYISVFDTPEGQRALRSPALAVTAPAHRATSFLQNVAPAAGAEMEKVYYPPVASVTLAYPKSALRQELPGVSETGGLQVSCASTTNSTQLNSTPSNNLAQPSYLLLLSFMLLCCAVL